MKLICFSTKPIGLPFHKLSNDLVSETTQTALSPIVFHIIIFICPSSCPPVVFPSKRYKQAKQGWRDRRMALLKPQSEIRYTVCLLYCSSIKSSARQYNTPGDCTQ